ncbi:MULTISPECIES: histone-like nucleoid-structuring protein, MvaT/MvaU family [Halomonas]|uniref:histone-like nucleoid-structuring protein, MvaT/MvaU family n=1 Tax=Halomonas TaxID=2745 RepID=UPI001A8E93E8|nr:MULTISPECIES: histone-like nucleoid-structuring protein, MvaT/MvaU family [Halomonas]MED5294480.1 histone-like nucleoid-structuring protein, MvaT/MvaU family [Pseudomonadota bacterium]MBN8411038.1 DNA binding protein [Halomonas litopenaei]MBY6208273.1 DNA binding protein [Halomonas sp. DP3Y7-2]MBY6229082.1 DNA binding protein [Halomonas sp. DP3Y7-1]MCA0916935.1 DNA binding protein [Halomonas denitrificans]
MSSLLNDYMQMEQQLQQLQQRLDQLQNDDRLKSELEFKGKLEELMKEFDKSSSDVIAILQPKPAAAGKAAAPAAGGRRKRKLKIYKNPNTGEVVETRGGNHKTLKAWKEEHGNDTVESWLVRVEG